MFSELKIAFIGKVSSGKSSIINSLLGGFYSSVSLLRDTDKIYEYKISNNESLSSDEIHSNFFPKITLLDYPGIDDSLDPERKFYKMFLDTYHNANVIVYVTDAYKAFIDQSEFDLFKEIKQHIDDHNNKGEYIELIILVNKYHKEEIELEEIYYRMCKKLSEHINIDNIYKFCAYKTFCDMIQYKQNKITICSQKQNNELTKMIRTIEKTDKFNITADTCVSLSTNKEEALCELMKEAFIKYLQICEQEWKEKRKFSYLKYLSKELETCEKYICEEKWDVSIDFISNIKYDYELGYDEDMSSLFLNTIYKIMSNDSCSRSKVTSITIIFLHIALIKKVDVTKFIKLFNEYDIKNFTLNFSCYLVLICSYYGCLNLLEIKNELFNRILSDSRIYDEFEVFWIIEDSNLEGIKNELINRILGEGELDDIEDYWSIEYSNFEEKVCSKFFFYYIIETKNIDLGYRYLFRLSKMSMNDIRYMDKMNLIEYNLFDSLFPQFKRNLRFEIKDCNTFELPTEYYQLFWTYEEEENAWDRIQKFINNKSLS